MVRQIAESPRLQAVLFDDLRLRPAQDVELFTGLDERAEGLVEVVRLVSGRELGPDAGLALGDDREEEAHGVDALIVEGLREVLGQLGVEEHDRDDRRVAFLEDETGFRQSLSPGGGVPLELVAPLRAPGQDLHDFDDPGYDDRRNGVREQVRTGFLAAHLDKFAPPGNAAAGGPPESLAERRRDDVDLADDPAPLMRPPPGLADETRGVGVVDEEHGVIFFAEGDHLVELGGVAVHGEDAVRDDDLEPLVGVELELALKVGHVRVLVGVVNRARKTNAVDEGRVDQPVRDHDVVLGQDGLEDAGVGVHARGEEERVLRPEEVRDPALQLAVDVLGPADEAHR